MHENALTLAQSRHVSQRMPRGHEYDRQSSRRFESQTRWNTPHVTRTCDGVRGKAENGETKHMVSGSNVHDIATQLP